MWTDLLLATLLAIAVLLVPGFVAARALGARWELALGGAPLLTLATYGVLSIAYGALGIPCGWATLAVPVAVVSAVVWAVRSRRGSWREALWFGEELERPFATSGPMRHITPIRMALLLALAAGVITSVAVFVCSIGDPNAFEQTYDNAWHLSRIHMFAETQDFSTFNQGFYPSAWHGIAAMVELALGVSTPLAENATNLAFIIGVFPLGSVLLLGTLFPDRPRVVCLGGMLCLSFAFFPWRIMLFGPLYPNLASFSMMPAEAALFIRLFAKETDAAERVRSGVLFVAGGVSMALAQPNAIFSTGTFLIPYCVWRMREYAYDRFEGCSHRRALALGAAAVLAVAFTALWVLLANAPFMAAVVNYPRMTMLSAGQAIRWGLGFSFVIRRQQFFIMAVVLLGALLLLLRPRRRWLTFSYALLLGIYVVAISVEGPLQHLVAGFWYSDYYRLAATVCVFCVPLVAMGMDTIVSMVMWCIRKASELTGRGRRLASRVGVVTSVAVVALILALHYVPFQFVPYHYQSWGFDAVAYELRDMYQNVSNHSLAPEERDFVERVKELVPEGEPVYNIPFDGSVFSYAACDLNVTYKSFDADTGANTSTLRMGLDGIATNEEVRAAAEREGIEYVLLLDQGAEKNGFSAGASLYLLSYDEKCWEGITGLSDDTPGFEVVLSEGDMRLYRIAD